jgi:hypothetical protein
MASSAPTVLILTQDFDPTVDPVVHSLKAREARVVRPELLPQDADVHHVRLRR